jgi:N-acetylglutamate synthase-like GNAT family acetyltransferase
MSHAIRRFRPSDAEAMVAFARSLPEHDLLFLSRDVREPRVVAAWLKAIEEGEIDSLIAEDDGQVVATAALVRDPLSWSAHVGEVRLLVASERRGAGLGSDLLQGIFMIAKERGLSKLIARMTVDQV